MNKIARLSKDKPWAILKISRKVYETNKPWKAAKMSREAFEELVRTAPPELVSALWDEAHADMLVKALGMEE